MPTVVFVLVALVEWTGIDPNRDAETVVAALVLAAVSGVATIGGMVYRRYIDPARRLPQPGSSAREPIRRLAEAEATLEDLLNQLDDKRLPPDWVDRTRYAIANTSHQLRSIADGIQAGERSLDRAEWRWERETLAEGVLESLDRLNRCLDGYDQLIAAAGHAVASAEPAPMDALTDATDHLTGLAQALQELRDHDR